MSRDPYDDWSKSLFEAARRERPQASARERTLHELLQRRTNPAGRWRWLALAAAVFGSVSISIVSRPPATPMLISAEQSRPVPARTPVAPPPPSDDAVPAISATPAPTLKDPALRAPLPRERPAEPARSKPRVSAEAPREQATLERELELLDQARRALAAGDAMTAQRHLDQYETALRGTQLALEAKLLRIQVLAAQGQITQATQLARAFIDQNPDSPLADRARPFALSPPHDPKPPAAGETP
jgi:hypothetical protein